MTVHITNLRGMANYSVAQIAQNMVAKIAHQEFGFNIFGTYFFNGASDEPKEQKNARFDGIIASLVDNDIVIIQTPSWNSIIWDEDFLNHLFLYKNIKKIIFIEDCPPLMWPDNRYLLKRYINYYNRADLLIVPSKNFATFLKFHGLRKGMLIVTQIMWDHLCQVNQQIKPLNTHKINFAGEPDKFKFIKEWPTSDVKLSVFGTIPKKHNNSNVNYCGWQNDSDLIRHLRQNGGFGLVWSENPYWRQYMKLNASYKVSTYLAAGIPVIINADSPIKDIILQKHLGIVINNLSEAIQTVKNISDFEYRKMSESVDSFANLIRQGYFTKRALIEAVFKVRYN